MAEIDQAGGSAVRRALTSYAARAARAVLSARVVLSALEHQDLSARLHLAGETRRIARAATGATSLEDVLHTAADDIARAFGLAGLCARVVGSATTIAHPACGRADPGDVPWLDRSGDACAAALWRRQRVGVLSVDSRGPDDPAGADDVRAYLRSRGYGSAAVVPLGAGPEVLGWLVLLRGASAPAWTGVEAAAAFDLGLDLGRVLVGARTLARERRLIAELQAVDAYKNRLIGTVSHELRNPLSAIRGNLELIGDVDLDPTVRRAVDVAERGVGRMSRVVDDLLRLARTLDDQAPAGTDRVELGGVVRDAADLLAEEARRGGVPLRVVVPEGPADVLGDRDLLGQIAVNLLSNAVKYSPSGRPVRCAVRVEGAEVELSVADRGIGISGEDQRRLFTEFFRSADPAVHAQPGTGLGLAIVDRLVRRHGGRIDVESELGSGTTVRVRVPLAPPV